MSVHYRDDSVTLLHGNALTLAGTLEADSVQTIVTSPPYFGLRDYGTDEQFGTEDTLDEYVQNLVGLFAALRPALRNDGTVWINLGDSYAGRANDGPSYRGNHQSFKKEGRVPGRKSTTAAAPFKNLLGVPWRVAFGLQADGWILRSDVIWSKPNPMPESVTDRPTKSHEYLFLLAKSPRYYFDADAIAEDVERPADPGTRVGGVKYGDSAAGENRTKGGKPIVVTGRRNKRSVWTVAPAPFPGAHFAVYPPELIRPCVLAGSRPGDVVLDPFSGSGTTGMVATQEGRKYVGIDLNADYLDLSLRTRFAQPALNMGGTL